MEENCVYVSLTLTVKNCRRDELEGTMYHLLESFVNFVCSDQIVNAFGAFFQKIELHCPSVGVMNSNLRYHPHLHLLGECNPECVPSQSQVATLWQQACGLDYTPVVEVKRI